MSKILSKFRGNSRPTMDQSIKPTTSTDTTINDSQNDAQNMLHITDFNRPIKELKEMQQWLTAVSTEVTTRCHQLSALFDIPRQMENEVKKSVEELLRWECETMAVLSETERIALQTTAVKVRHEQARQKLRQARAEEGRKSEELAELCWKPLRARWLTLKTKRNQSEIRKFIDEAKEKQKGLEVLQQLAQARLDKLEEQTRARHLKPTRLPVRKQKSIRETSEDGDDESSNDSEKFKYQGVKLLFIDKLNNGK